MLSIVLATFNEENNIVECLESVKNIADEIIVVDGGSSDKTVEKARQYTSKITVTDNPPIFHINKQKALDLATGDWILQLDADERITDDLKNEIKKVTADQYAKNGYYIKRRNFFLGQWLRKGGQYPDPVIRLFRKGMGKFPCKNIHEQIEIEGETGTLENDMLHYSSPTFAKYLINSNRYTSLTATEYADRNAGTDIISVIYYTFIKPVYIFLSLYLRHKGFMDGYPGFVFAFFSGLHIFTSYIKYWEMSEK